MHPAFELIASPQFLPSYSVVSTVDWMNWSPFCEMESEMSSSQLCAAYSAVQITSMPSTSHSEDLACRRWIWRRRCSTASSGSSSSLTFAPGFALLKLSTTVPKAPVVSLPMHQVTLPEAFACVAFSALGAPPLSSPPPPQPTAANSAVTTSATSIRAVFIIECPSSWASSIRAYPLARGSTRVTPLADLLGQLLAEGREIVRPAARHEAVVHHDLLVDPIAAGVADIGLNRRPRGDGPVAHDVGLHERPGAVADYGHGLLRV